MNDSTTAAPMQHQSAANGRRNFLGRAMATGLSAAILGGMVRTTGSSALDATPAGDGNDMALATDHYALADEDAEAVWFLGTLALIKGVGSLTGGTIATVEFVHPPGFATPLHVHHLADESFYVLEGSIQGVFGDQRWRGTTGSFIWLPRGVPHGYVVEGDETLRTLAIALPAGFDRFIVEGGEPAQQRTLPPPGPPDIAKLDAAGARYGIETVGPPIQLTGTPTT